MDLVLFCELKDGSDVVKTSTTTMFPREGAEERLFLMFLGYVGQARAGRDWGRIQLFVEGDIYPMLAYDPNGLAVEGVAF